MCADAFLKQAHLLKDKGDLLHQLRGGDASHIPSAQEHRPCLHIEKARDQPGDGGLAAAGGAHQRPRLPLRQMEAHIRQRGPVRAVIGKGDVFKGNAAVRGLASAVRRRLGKGRLLNIASSLFTASAASICALTAYISRSIIKASRSGTS